MNHERDNLRENIPSLKKKINDTLERRSSRGLRLRNHLLQTLRRAIITEVPLRLLFANIVGQGTVAAPIIMEVAGRRAHGTKRLAAWAWD